MTTTTDTTSATDGATDNAADELQPDVADDTTTDGTVNVETRDSGGEDDSEVVEDRDDDSDDEDDGDGPSREAAKYRRRLRDTEAERDRLAEQVESLQRAEVERQATVAELRPAALWASGSELADLLSDDGTVDAAKVSAAIAAAREQLGIPDPPVGPLVPREGRSVRRPAKPSGKAAMVGVVMGRGD